MTPSAPAAADETGLEIAVIGMSGRFPGANNVREFWSNLVSGVDTISRFTDEELREAGVSPTVLDDENYVPAKGVFPRLEQFDAGFFGYTPADARIMDPQIRALHEEVYHALEDAGYTSAHAARNVGVFLGATNNMPWEAHILRKEVIPSGVMFTGTQLADKDFAATRIAYTLNLTGPAITMQTACSTSLIAIDMACRHIWTGSCTMAVAGGSGLTLPHRNGYVYQPSMINSADGTCRAFDAAADGTVEGNGAGVVVLKRLERAVRDGDHIYAVIKGSAANNDGNRKVGYTAPSIEGQAEVIRKALRVANVDPTTVRYVETHGTGTALGDPIEVEALRKSYGSGTPRSIGIGSTKSAIGHTDSAAGVSSFIKAAKVLHEREIPASMHFSSPNPAIDFDSGPFYVVADNEDLSDASQDGPLRAAVSAFGIGGTNAHLVLQEPPRTPIDDTPGRRVNTLVMAGNSPGSIARNQQNFIDFLATADCDPQELAWTMQNRQRDLPYRWSVAFRDLADLRGQLQTALEDGDDPTRVNPKAAPRVVFSCSGLGAQHVSMARGLHDSEERFRTLVDAGLDMCDELGDPRPRTAFFGDEETAAPLLDRIDTAQILLLIVEYAMATVLMEWGVTPDALIGHSTGELTAACLAGVFSFEDAVRLVHARGTLQAETPEGAMCSVKASEERVRAVLTAGVEIATINTPTDCTVSGTPAAVAAFEEVLDAEGIEYSRVAATRAGHWAPVEDILDRFREVARTITFRAPQLRYISNVTGTWITPEQATDPDYYCTHLRQPVQFAKGLETLMEAGPVVFLEVGPGKSLSSFTRSTGQGRDVTPVNMFRHRLENTPDEEHLAGAVGRIWSAGVRVQWDKLHVGRRLRKISLPAYPFDPVDYPVDITEFTRWVDDGIAPLRASGASTPSAPASTSLRLEWSPEFLPVMRRAGRPRVILAFTDDWARLRNVLDPMTHWRTFPVTFAEKYSFDVQHGCQVRPHHSGDLDHLLRDLAAHRMLGDTVLVDRESPAAVRHLVPALTKAVRATATSDIYQDVVILDRNNHYDKAQLHWLMGVNLESPGTAVTSLAVEDPRSAAQWGAALTAELDADAPAEFAIRHAHGQRLVPRMVPLMRSGHAVAPRADRTVIVCPEAVATETLQHLSASHPARPLTVVPYALGRDPGEQQLPQGQGRHVIVAPVWGRTAHAVAAALVDRLSNLGQIDEIVMWDCGPTPRSMFDGADRTILREVAAVAHRRDITVTAVSAFNPTAGVWDRHVTDWFVASLAESMAAGCPRTYLLSDAALERPFLDESSHMVAAGITARYEAVDLQSLLAAAGNEQPSEEAPTAQSAEEAVVQELSRLLGLDEVPVGTDMFDLGLDSVKLVALTRALEGHGYNLVSTDVYNNPTARRLGRFLSESATDSVATERSADAVAERITTEVGVDCRYARFVDWSGDEHVVVLCPDPDQHRSTIVSTLQGLRPGSEFLPDYIWSSDLDTVQEEEGTLPRVVAAPFTEPLPFQKYFDRMDQSHEAITRSLSSQPVRWHYDITGVQKYHFKGTTPLQLYMISFTEYLDVDLLRQAMCDVVGRHGALRSMLTRNSLGRMRWAEHAPPTELDVPLLDLSTTDPREQDEFRKALVKRKWNLDFHGTGHPMFTVVLVKYHEQRYEMFFQFDHSIFDVGSGQVLRSDLLARYRQLVAGTTKAMPGAVSYRKLAEKFAAGPTDITADEIIDKFDLKSWTESAVEIRKASEKLVKPQNVQHFRFSFDFSGLDIGSSDPFGLVVYLYSRLVSRVLDVPNVAMDVLFRSRAYEGRDYSDMMGMMLGSVPVLVPADRDGRWSLESAVQDRLTLMDRHNIHFLNLFSNLRLMMKFGKVFGATKDIRGKANQAQTLLLNYAGNTEREYEAIWDMTMDQLTDDTNKLDYADCYGVAKTSGTTVDILFIYRWDIPVDELRDILADEVEHFSQTHPLAPAT